MRPRLPVSYLLLIAICAFGCSPDESDDDGDVTGTVTSNADAGGDTTTGAAIDAESGDDTAVATADALETDAIALDTRGTEDAATLDLGVDDVSGEDAALEDVAPSGEFDAIFGEVFVPNGCTAGYCHGESAGGLQLRDPAVAWEQLVSAEATSAGCGTTLRVVPGDPDASALWQRVRGDGGEPSPDCLPKMPAGSDGLSAADAERIRAWIAAGAPR